MRFAFIVVMLALISFVARSESPGGGKILRVDAPAQMRRLLQERDRDHDKRITVDDLRKSGTAPSFFLRDVDQKDYEVSGISFLSNLLQELKIASDEHPRDAGLIRQDHVFENPVGRLSRLIRERYWDHLTRRVDGNHLERVLEDSKLPPKSPKILYVPADDEAAFVYFTKVRDEHPNWNFKVDKLSKDGEFDRAHGLLALALRKNAKGTTEGVPFVVPGGRFNEMYGWDSYFESLGLLVDDRVDLARAMVDNFVYEIEHYGKILNANRTYYLNRSQPPFLTSMIRAVYERREKTDASKEWLRHSLKAAMREYSHVWTSGGRLTPIGLSRYFGSGQSIPPEVEPGHFEWVLKPAAKRHHLTVAELRRQYESGRLKDAELTDFFEQDRAVRESGHDTTYRWRVDGRDRAADFATVDLNSLLYKYELDFARLIRENFGDRFEDGDGKTWTSKDWRALASNRRELMRKYLWDAKAAMFFDFDFKTLRPSGYVSATAFYPLWAADADDSTTKILNDEEATKLVENLLRELEQPGGISSTSLSSLRAKGDLRQARQWEYPNGWAPHQMLIWEALRNANKPVIADRLIYKWLYTITKNAADYNGTVPEKYDVVKRSHAVFAEYGNVGTDFSYITEEGFGWMNASYQVGLKKLSAAKRAELEKLIPPEWLDF